MKFHKTAELAVNDNGYSTKKKFRGVHLKMPTQTEVFEHVQMINKLKEQGLHGLVYIRQKAWLEKQIQEHEQTIYQLQEQINALEEEARENKVEEL